MNPATLATEQQVVEHGYTLGSLNRHAHAYISANARLPHIVTAETGHLKYEQGKGVVKIEEATCSLCEEWGLNDGRWHEVPRMN